MKQYIAENFDKFTELDVSTNRVRRFEFEGRGYVIKVQTLEDDKLSPFWHMMSDVFGLSFRAMRQHGIDVYDILSENPHIPVAKPVLVDQEKRYMVFEAMPGKSWIPDTFPYEREVSLQLGRFIGFNHTHTFEKCGVAGVLDVVDVKARLIKHCRGRAVDMDIDCELNCLCREALEDVDKPSEYGLIMTDISANQFLFGRKSISACVDIDAYVIAPIEWELAVLRNCVPDWKSFCKGYVEYRPLPEEDRVCRLFGYIME